MISNNTNMSGFSVPFFYIDNPDLFEAGVLNL